MKKTNVIALFCVIFCLVAAAPVFSQTPKSLGELKDTMDEFSNNLALSLPFNSSMGLNWSDANLKSFPRFGAGFSLGYTTMKAGAFGDILDQFGFSLPVDLGGFPVPGYALEGRLGGFVLPFDVGFKFGYLPIKPAGIERLDYFLVGGDVRYAVIKGNIIIPTVSVGVGFNYLSGTLGQKAGSDQLFDYIDRGGTSRTMVLSAPTVDINWETATLDFKAQISKSLFFITPYLGIGASNGWSKAGYKVKTSLDDGSGGSNLADAAFFAKQFGIDDISSTGFSAENEFTGWSFRAFGGLSFNIAIVKLDLTALFNFIDQNYGVTFGTRVQL